MSWLQILKNRMGGLGPILSGSRYRPVAGGCEEYNEFLGSIKYGEYSLLGGKLLASEEDLLLTYLLTPWSRVLLEKLTSKLCS